MPHSRQDLLSRLSGVRQESDGSALADCPVCSLDGKGQGKVKVYADGSLVCYRFNGTGRDASRQHVRDILSALGLDVPVSAFIRESLLDGKLTLELSPADRGRVRVVARNCDSVLARDEFHIDRMAERTRFVSSLDTLTDEERKQVAVSLVGLADRFDRAQRAVDQEQESEGNTQWVISKALSDGRLIEQIAGGVFAIYDPATRSVIYAPQVEYEDSIYRPLDDDFILRGGMHLPDRLLEYQDDRTLDAEIEAYIKRYCDAPDRELRLAAKYVRFSYIADKTNELSYFRATGGPGSGKSRFIGTVGSICLRPILVTNPSAAALYRMLDAYSPTLIVDECNFEAGSEDSSTLMQVLNCGFQRLTLIPRMERGPEGRMTLRMFSAYGPKLIGSLKVSDSPAFESRCVAVALQKTARRDIPFRMTERMMCETAELRAKLTLWRVRNWHRDYEEIFDRAEAELKDYSIEPRFIQIAIPLYGMLAEDQALKASFARMLEGRTEDAASERQESFDGRIVAIIHDLLFEVQQEGDEESIQPAVTFRPEDGLPEPEDGKPCELVLIDTLTERINEGLPEKRHHDSAWIGRFLRKLGLKSEKIKRGPNRDRRLLVFNREALFRLFLQFSLPVPPDFAVPSVPNAESAYDFNDLGMGQQNETTTQSEFTVPHSTDSNSSSYKEWAGWDSKNTGNRGEEVFETSESAVPPLVALDTETEPFDLKRGITHRNARMIGLALCYDGNRADYETNPDCWPLLMPEPVQTVIFHNAKFDLGVLDRAGLPLPERWEDTLIAAHLLDENSDHGLKELARAHLGIDSPLTFDEADRMRLLDPEVFNEYARNDSRYTYRLWERFKPQLERQDLMRVYNLEKALVPLTRDMERAGMRIDLSLLGTLNAEVGAEIERVRAEIFDLAGCQFDLNSPAKVAAILYDKLGVPCKGTTDGGKPSVDREALSDVRGYHPVVDAILRYREIDKLASTFLNVLPAMVDSSGRIHPEFKPLGPKGGRFSCSDPNVQQIPARSELGKRLREAFITETGCKLVVADYSQMELRVLAHFSRDPDLVAAYTSEQEIDLHTLTASKMFKKAIADVTGQERKVAKMINFGIAYGITPTGLFNRLRPEGVDVTEAQCEKFIEDYFNTYKGVRTFLERVITVIKRRGYVRSLFGRRRRLTGRTARERRQAENFIIQASAADIAKDAMVRLDKALPESARLIAQIHDEFIVECPESDAEQVREVMIEVMSEAPAGFTIPLKVDAHIGESWGDAKG